MRFFLGIDGGGSGCRAVLADAAGARLGEGASGPANIYTDPDGALANLLAAARAAAGEVPFAEIAAGLGLAGITDAGGAERLRAALPFGRAGVVSDAVIALDGAHGGGDGVLSSIGTGSVHAARQGDAVRRIGGHGFLLGDEGSGAWMGRRLLARALHAHDGLAPRQGLLAETLERFGDAPGILDFARRAAPADYAAEMPGLLAADRAGDAEAGVILDRAAETIAAAIAALQPAGAPPLPVVLAGGLGPVFAARLRGRWPMREARGGPLDGALSLARRVAR